jgi:O-antigen ligase
MVWFQISVAAILAVGVLWTKAEYGLFLYGALIGFPDLALPLSSTINVRADDIILLLLLPSTMLWKPATSSPRQRKIFVWQGLFFAACLLSVAVQIGRGDPPGAYEAVKMIGCAVIILGLPRLVQSERRLRFLISGLMCGGIALVTQVFFRLGNSSANEFANVQEMKSAATFTTWNPNTIGQAAVLLAFAAGLGGIILARSQSMKFIWLCAAMGFALLPAMMFVRGTSLSLAAGFFLYFCLARRWKSAILFLLVCFSVLLYLRTSDRRLTEEATAVNLSTGEGLSHRFDRWNAAIQGIETRPFFGHGFGQEWSYLSDLGSEGRAHNAYLTVWLELGLGGLLLFIAAIAQFFLAALSLYKDPRLQLQGALILSLMVALAIDSLGLPTLYWEKLPTITLSLAVIVVGLSERNAMQFAERNSLRLARGVIAKHP